MQCGILRTSVYAFAAVGFEGMEVEEQIDQVLGALAMHCRGGFREAKHFIRAETPCRNDPGLRRLRRGQFGAGLRLQRHSVPCTPDAAH